MELQCQRERLAMLPDIKTKIELLEQIERMHSTHRKMNDKHAMAQSRCNTAICLLFMFGMATVLVRLDLVIAWTLIPIMVVLLVGSIASVIEYSRFREHANYDAIWLESSLRQLAPEIEKSCAVGCLANVLDDTVRMYYNNLVCLLTQK